MRFKEYLQEEYFTRTKEFEIFINPNNKEINDLFRIRKAMRALVDFENKTYFLFDSDLLHQTAAREIAKEYKSEGVFSCMEVYLLNGSIRVRLADDTYKIVPGKSFWINMDEEPTKEQMKWFKYKFKDLFLKFSRKKIDEEYFGRGDARNKSFEVFRNPSKKEYREAIEASLDHGTKGFIRLLIDIKTKDVYVASGKALHDEIADVIDEENNTDTAHNYENYYYPLVGFLNGEDLEITNSSLVKFNRDEIEDIINTMEKKTYYNVSYRGR